MDPLLCFSYFVALFWALEKIPCLMKIISLYPALVGIVLAWTIYYNEGSAGAKSHIIANLKERHVIMLDFPHNTL